MINHFMMASTSSFLRDKAQPTSAKRTNLILPNVLELCGVHVGWW